MNYPAIYQRLIERAKTRPPLEGYQEVHHILPRCMGGSDSPDNLVDLTAEEHYVAHQLLVKIYPGNDKIVYAAHMMCMGRMTNKLYAWVRQRHAKAIVKIAKQRIGPKNGAFGSKWICNRSTEENAKLPAGQPLPDGWEYGRSNWNCPEGKIPQRDLNGRKFYTVHPETKRLNKRKRQEKALQEKSAESPKKRQLRERGILLRAEKKAFTESQIRKLWNDFLAGNHESLRAYHKAISYPRTFYALTVMFKKYIPEYGVLCKPRKCLKSPSC